MNNRLKARKRVFLQVEQLEHRDAPATTTVNTHVDANVRDNDLSFREGVLLANGQLGFNDLTANEKNAVNGMPAANQADNIHFNLGNPNNAIVLTKALPYITDQVTIDGFTQAGSAANTAAFGQARNASYKIELDGTNADDGVAFSITGGTGTIIRGLSIVNFRTTLNFQNGAIEILTNKNTIEDNSIGIDRAGQTKGNGGGGAVIIRGGENVIKNNLISGNT